MLIYSLSNYYKVNIFPPSFCTKRRRKLIMCTILYIYMIALSAVLFLNMHKSTYTHTVYIYIYIYIYICTHTQTAHSHMQTHTHTHTQSCCYQFHWLHILTQQWECNSKHKDDDSPKHIDDQISCSQDDEHTDQWVVALKLASLPLVVGAIDIATKCHWNCCKPKYHLHRVDNPEKEEEKDKKHRPVTLVRKCNFLNYFL